jgi:DNA-directed RNA polymerase subunit RPC12/RpoP
MPSATGPVQLAQIAPLLCPQCNGKAHLARRTPDAFKRDGKTEHWTYECFDCGHRIEKTVEI